MKIIADENIPQVKEAFSLFGEVELFSGRDITNEVLRNTDVLLVRSITKVDSSLLDNTKIKFVGTATIGTDHIDQEYLKEKNIFFADAAGCNAYSVAEYIVSAITNIYNKLNRNFFGKSIGIIGCGNVGSKVANFAEALGFEIIINDPPLERKFGKQNFQSLEDALQADIITLHVPLNLQGIDKTFHLINEKNLLTIKKDTILINSSRGQVIDNLALKNQLNKNKNLYTVLDVWENEPTPDHLLLSLTDISTAHIAGYSLEGKLNGTLYIYQNLCDFIKAAPTWQPLYPEIKDKIIDVDSTESTEKILLSITLQIYDITSDSTLLKGALKLSDKQVPKYFDKLRKEYQIRREFDNYTIRLSMPNPNLKRILEQLRFTVI